MEEIIVYINNKSNHPIPTYATSRSSGMDVKANLKTPLEVLPNERTMISTGIYIALPEGYEAQIRPRSGLAAKNGITIINTPRIIDSDYTGEKSKLYSLITQRKV